MGTEKQTADFYYQSLRTTPYNSVQLRTTPYKKNAAPPGRTDRTGRTDWRNKKTDFYHTPSGSSNEKNF